MRASFLTDRTLPVKLGPKLSPPREVIDGCTARVLDHNVVLNNWDTLLAYQTKTPIALSTWSISRSLMWSAEKFWPKVDRIPRNLRESEQKLAMLGFVFDSTQLQGKLPS